MYNSKKLKISFLLITILLFIYFEGCTLSIFTKNYKSEIELNKYIDKYPLLGFFYLDKIDIKKAFLSIKNKEVNFPLFIIDGQIEYSSSINIRGRTQIGSNLIDVFILNYNFLSHRGYLEDISSKLKYDLSSENLKISKQLVIYLEKNSFLLLLMLKDRIAQNIRNGEFIIDDIIFTLKDYKIEKAVIESQTLPLVVYYKNYRKWNNIFYPSIINISFKDYEINILLSEANFSFSF